MRVFITGIAGFFGSHLAERYIEKGWEVAGCDDLNTGRKKNVPTEALFIRQDIVSEEVQKELLKFRPHLIVHAAAKYLNEERYESLVQTNILGSYRIGACAKSLGAPVLYCQTALIYSNVNVPRTSDTPIDPVCRYAKTKLAGEWALEESGARVVSMRMANLMGPRNFTGPVISFWRGIRNQMPCKVKKGAVRDFIYVKDAAKTVVAESPSIVEGDYPRIAHLAGGFRIKIQDLWSMICEIMQIKYFMVEFLEPERSDVLNLTLEPTQRMRVRISAEQLITDSAVKFKADLAETLEWYDRL